MARLLTLLLLFLGLLGPGPISSAWAHPVARKSHDRVVQVRLTADALLIDYHLEVDDWTIVFVDLPAVSDRVDLTKLTQPREFYEAFRIAYGPILADNLDVRLDGKPLRLECVGHRHEVRDSVQYDFRFRAAWRLEPGTSHRLTVREGNYETEPGLVKVLVAAADGVRLVSQEVADEALQAKPATEWKPGDEERLRKAAATFVLDEGSAAAETPAVAPSRESGEAAEAQAFHERLKQLLDQPWGFWAALALMLGWGAYHALTPGHGKTLVAAYLVGERGTVWHALFLGLVTTVSHTGVLLLLALLFRVWPDRFAPLMGWLPALSGLLLAGMGAWLFFCRLSGRADHVHLIGGHHHHHHHGDGDAHGHYHDGHGHGHGHGHGDGAEPAGWGRLFVLGVSGGLLPCPAAVVITVAVINAQHLELALPLLLAFSAGLGGVLVAIGIAVVRVKGFAEARWGGGHRRLFRLLPIASAALVTVLGLWMFRDAIK